MDVSAVTVSKALSGQKGVSDEMREKIVRLAEEMGYQRREGVGRMLRRAVGVIVADRFIRERQSFYWKIYRQLSVNMIAAESFSILEVISQEAEAEAELPHIVTDKKADAVIVLGSFSEKYVGKLKSSSALPILFLDFKPEIAGCDVIMSDNISGGYRVTNYLIELGHKKIGYVGTLFTTQSIDNRYLGYCKALLEHGIELRSDWVIADRNIESGVIDRENCFKLPSGELPTAFFCNCDMSAGFFIQKLNEAGFSVPYDISVAGFDNYMSEGILNRTLTTYEVDIEEIAGCAMRMIMDRIAGSDKRGVIVVIEGRLVVGDSTSRKPPKEFT